jgi:hypothetical protein
MIDSENVFMDGFLVEYVYPFRMINQHLFNVTDDDLVIHELEGHGNGLDQ